MLDRQKLEAILTHRFPTAATAQLAAAANAIIGLADDPVADCASRPDEPQRPSTTVAVSVDIAAPTYRVFDVLTDFARAAERVRSIKGVEMLTPGRFALGARWRETREASGHLAVTEMEVIAFEQDRTYVLSRDEAGVRVEIVFSFEWAGTGTRVLAEFTLGDQADRSPGFQSPLSWTIAGSIRDVLDRDLAELKAHVEARAVLNQG
jgi:polyketide cyclase/dehydrase/lipid transport protein